jgi:hypothetical protein
MQERAQGSRPGVLERLLESVRGNPFSRDKCAEIAAAFSVAERLLASERSADARMRILKDLDATVKAISYRN